MKYAIIATTTLYAQPGRMEFVGMNEVAVRRDMDAAKAQILAQDPAATFTEEVIEA